MAQIESGRLHDIYEIFRTRDSYPGERTPHSHEFYEVNLILTGSIHYQVEGRSYHLTQGDLMLIAPGESHRPDPETAFGGCERMVLWMDQKHLRQFQGFDPTACFGASRPDRSCCLRFDDESTVRIYSLLDRCLRERASGEFGAGMMADTSAIQAMILINRRYLRSGPGEKRDRSDTLVSNVMAYINAHYAEELTLDDLANRFFISKYHLSREFGRLAGTPVHRYIVQIRLAAAKQLLSEGRPSSEVSQRCGFGDYSNFYRAFRSEYGISPKAYAVSLERGDIG